MKLVLVLTAEKEDIRLPHNLSLSATAKYIHNSGGLPAKPGSRITLLPREGVNMNIYVGNLSLEVIEEELRQEFMAFGEVLSVIIMNDRYIGSGQSRGYGFVEMPSPSEGNAAITALNQKALKHMMINVIEALPLSDHKDKGSLHSKRPSHFSGRVRERRY